MRLSATRIKELEELLEIELGLKYKGQELDWAALAIMRFVLSKHTRENLPEAFKKDQRNEAK